MCLYQKMLRNNHLKIGFRHFHKVTTRFSDQSYVHGACDIPLLNDTVADRFRLALEQGPDKLMVIFKQCGIRKSYQQVFDDARQLGASLINLKLKKGDRIGIWGPNYYEWVVTKYAAALSGLILVNINPAYKADELKFALHKVGVSAILSPIKYKTSDYYRTLTEVVPKMLQCQDGIGAVSSKDLPELKHVILFKTDKKFRGAWNFDELIQSPGSEAFKLLDQYESQIRVDDPFNIQFTSGTTGRPKAATLSHHNVVNNAFFIGLRAGFHQNEEKLVIPVPLSHAFGFVIGLLNSVCHHQTVIFPSPSFNAKSVLEAINDEKPTLIYGTPTMFIDILNEPLLKSTDLSSVHGGMTGGAPAPAALCQKMIKTLGMKDYVNTYGSTEISPLIAMSYPDDEENAKVISVGHVMPHLEMAIVNENGNFVKRAEKGELIARGYSVMSGYWNDEEKTKEVIEKDRWYHTGDVASMNPDGSIIISGRYKDMIIRGGENLYPTEIEQFIFKHPSVADAQVIGVPDERMGEEVCAWIRLKPGTILTAEELTEFLRDKISHNKIPRYILFKSEHDFPLTPSGKIKKYELRNLSKKELNLESVTPHFNE